MTAKAAASVSSISELYCSDRCHRDFG